MAERLSRGKKTVERVQNERPDRRDRTERKDMKISYE